MIYCSETRVENLEPNEEKKNSSATAKKSTKKSLEKHKQEDSGSSIVESSKESIEACHPSKKCCIVNRKCSHSTDSCKDLRAMVSKHKQKKKKNFKSYRKSNKELNALIEKKFQTVVKNKKRRKIEIDL